MYGMNSLPNTGIAGVTAGTGAGLTGHFWLALFIITLLAVVMALGRMLPRRES